jgi:hypothetical protein
MRLAPRLFQILSALSLLVFVAILILCGRSFFLRDEFVTQHSGIQQMWDSDFARIHFGIFHITPDNGNNCDWTWDDNAAPGNTLPLVGSFWLHAHFGIGWAVPGSLACRIGKLRFQVVGREWWVPYWLIALLALPLATVLPLQFS